MFSTKKARDSITDITLEELLTKVTEYDIYASYLGHFKVGMIYNSPFRKDKNPSFGCYYSRKTRELLFKDHGSGECGNVIKFVSLITGYTNYNDILMEIVNKLKITNNTKRITTTVPELKETVIGVVKQPFTKVDLEYWSRFCISEPTLKIFEVSSIKYYLSNGVVKGIYNEFNPMFAYRVYNKYKIYRPLGNKHVKWRSNLTEVDIQGYKQLPANGDVLIITKALKDVMCLYEMGIAAIAPQSESSFIPDNALQDVLKRFKRVYINFDRDAPGVRYLRKISLKTGLPTILVHKKFKSKDLSDAIASNGIEQVKEWLLNVLKTNPC